MLLIHSLFNIERPAVVIIFLQSTKPSPRPRNKNLSCFIRIFVAKENFIKHHLT